VFDPPVAPEDLDLPDIVRYAGTQAAIPSITIAQTVDCGVYDCVVTNNCGSATSLPAARGISPSPGCRSDVNHDNAVDGDGVIRFFARWSIGC